MKIYLWKALAYKLNCVCAMFFNVYFKNISGTAQKNSYISVAFLPWCGKIQVKPLTAAADTSWRSWTLVNSVFCGSQGITNLGFTQESLKWLSYLQVLLNAIKIIKL